jgi:hypothetical protein
MLMDGDYAIKPRCLPNVQILNIDLVITGKVICLSPSDTYLVMKFARDTGIKIHFQVYRCSFSPLFGDNTREINANVMERPVFFLFFENCSLNFLILMSRKYSSEELDALSPVIKINPLGKTSRVVISSNTAVCPVASVHYAPWHLVAAALLLGQTWLLDKMVSAVW